MEAAGRARGQSPGPKRGRRRRRAGSSSLRWRPLARETSFWAAPQFPLGRLFGLALFKELRKTLLVKAFLHRYALWSILGLPFRSRSSLTSLSWTPCKKRFVELELLKMKEVSLRL